MKEVVESDAVEDGVMSKVVLQPSSLSLRDSHENCSYEPCCPRIAKVPEDPPCSDIKEEDVCEQSNEEPHIHLEVTLHGCMMHNYVMLGMNNTFREPNMG